VVSNVGGWIQSVAAGWLMIDLDPSPLMVGMVQTTSALPFFLLALPVGALGDIVDRRRSLLVAQSWSLLAAAALAGATAFGWITPWMLLGFTLALGVGAAMTAPIWQAIIPEVVPRPDLLAAIALGSVGFNLARTVGPPCSRLSSGTSFGQVTRDP
jgi:MFS family permease